MDKYLDKNAINEFCQSLNLGDLKKLYSISNNVENNYRVYKIKKKNGKFRTIYSPSKNLKEIQRKILKNILEKEPISKYAKAYKKGFNLKDNVSVHVKQKIVVKLDIKNFFESITFGEVMKNCFPYEYFPHSISVLLTKLCTYYDFVPQGAPTSSYIANLVLKDFDNEIGNFCEQRKINYTRYSDDLTFSGDFNYKELIKTVKEKLLVRGYLLNKGKIHVVSQKSRQVVTGLVVNEKINVPINYRKKIRQELYYINKYGINEHLKRIKANNPEKYLKSLKGRISYCKEINPNNFNKVLINLK